jgi:hypothetical protein
VEYAAGFDHIVYGLFLFALVMAVLLGASWRFFDRAANDPLVDVGAIEASPAIERLGRHGIGGWQAVALMMAAVLLGGLAGAGVGP